MEREGEVFGPSMIVRGSLERLVSVTRTALTAGLALVPLVLAAHEPDKEILYLVAVVILGGLISSTLPDMTVTPAVFLAFGRRAAERALSRGRHDPLDTTLTPTPAPSPLKAMNKRSMKTSHLLLAALAAFALSRSPAVAVDNHDHAPGGEGHAHGDQPEWADLFGGASLALVWQSATAASERITTALNGRTTDGVADWAETIHLAAHALIDQVNFDDTERRRRLDAALAQAAKLADEVLDAAQHKEHDRASVAFKRLQSALAVAKTRLPKRIVDAPVETPRFAKAPEHGGDHGHAHGGDPAPARACRALC